MGKHVDVHRNRTAMLEALRSGIANRTLLPGEKLPPLRELMAQYSVSMNVAWEALQTLIDEGALHSVPRKGVFVGHPQNEADIYLLTSDVSPDMQAGGGQFTLGFEERIASLGGASIFLLQRDAKQLLQQNQLPPLAGIVRTSCYGAREIWWPENLPCVEVHRANNALSGVDIVGFNNFEGGRKAAQHLWSQGHRRIGFLGLHSADNLPLGFHWSIQRQAGWAEFLRDQGAKTEGLAFLDVPSEACRFTMDLTHEESRAVARRLTSREILPRLLDSKPITALIAVNLLAAYSMIRVLADSGLEAGQWPAILTFDDAPTSPVGLVSYLRLPWDELGREAAQLVWDRRNGRLVGPEQHRTVELTLIPRLTCRPSFTRNLTAASMQYIGVTPS